MLQTLHQGAAWRKCTACGGREVELWLFVNPAEAADWVEALD